MHPLVAVLRSPLNLVPPEAQVFILSGPLRGMRWIVGSGNHVCWLGLYEYRKQRILQHLISARTTVYDVGAHVGFHSLLTSRLVGPLGHVCAFEPLPRNQHYLREHLRLNRIGNVQIVEAAVADRPGTEHFVVRGTYMGGLDATGQIQVTTVTIDNLVDTGTIPPPDYVKIDVEGGEARALLGMRETLIAYHPTILLATHGQAVHRDCIQFLQKLAYRVRPLSGGDVFQTDELIADHPAFVRSVFR